MVDGTASEGTRCMALSLVAPEFIVGRVVARDRRRTANAPAPGFEAATWDVRADRGPARRSTARWSFNERAAGTCNFIVGTPIVICLDRGGDALHREHFDDVANLQVVEAIEADAALKAGLDLADIVLEAAQ